MLTEAVKDGCNGLGECAVHKESGDRVLPNKTLPFAFCVLDKVKAK